MSTEVVWATGAGEERQIDHAQATVGGQGAETSGHPVAITGPTAGVVDVAADAAWQRQANRQRGVRSDGFETPATAWRREPATYPGNICVASNSPVERTRRTVGVETRLASRAAHRRVIRTRKADERGRLSKGL